MAPCDTAPVGLNLLGDLSVSNPDEQIDFLFKCDKDQQRRSIPIKGEGSVISFIR